MEICLISYESYTVFKYYLGVIFFIDLLYFTPWLQMMFGSAYQLNSIITSRARTILLFFIWMLSCANILFQNNAFIGFLLLSLIFRFFYVESRTSNLFRGGGAVGILPALLVSYFTVIELMNVTGLAWINSQYVLCIMIIHIGIIMLDSSINKMTSGFFSNQGFQFAFFNPFWSYWSSVSYLRKLPNSLWKIINLLIPITQCFIALLIICPTYQYLGIVSLSIGFIFLTFIVRLGTLTILITSFITLFLNLSTFEFTLEYTQLIFLFKNLNIIVLITGLIYLFILVFGQLIVWLNFYFSFFLWNPIQNILNKINWHFPILIWRVFTPDVVNLYCKIYEIKNNGIKIPLNKSFYDLSFNAHLLLYLRFFNVAESCVLSSIFNSLKYNNKNYNSVVEKIKQYCSTLTPHLDRIESSIEFVVYHIVIREMKPPLDLVVSKWEYDGINVKKTFINKNLDTPISSFIRPFRGSGSYK